MDTLFDGRTSDCNNPFIGGDHNGSGAGGGISSAVVTVAVVVVVIRMMMLIVVVVVVVVMIGNVGYYIIFRCQSYRNDPGRFFHIFDIGTGFTNDHSTTSDGYE